MNNTINKEIIIQKNMNRHIYKMRKKKYVQILLNKTMNILYIYKIIKHLKGF